MGYDCGDSFPFNFESNGIPFGLKSKRKLSPPSYPIQIEKNWKYSFFSAVWSQCGQDPLQYQGSPSPQDAFSSPPLLRLHPPPSQDAVSLPPLERLHPPLGKPHPYKEGIYRPLAGLPTLATAHQRISDRIELRIN